MLINWLTAFDEFVISIIMSIIIMLVVDCKLRLCKAHFLGYRVSFVLRFCWRNGWLSCFFCRMEQWSLEPWWNAEWHWHQVGSLRGTWLLPRWVTTYRQRYGVIGSCLIWSRTIASGSLTLSSDALALRLQWNWILDLQDLGFGSLFSPRIRSYLSFYRLRRCQWWAQSFASQEQPNKFGDIVVGMQQNLLVVKNCVFILKKTELKRAWPWW